MNTPRDVVLYIATSLDGYIARPDEALDWLVQTEGDGDNGYHTFYETVDTILLGRKTYDWILGNVPEFPYRGKRCYVFSRRQSGRTDSVEFIHDDIVDFTRALKHQPGKKIWVVGGGEVLNLFLRDKLIDELVIQIAPIIIGRGIPLFKADDYEFGLYIRIIVRLVPQLFIWSLSMPLNIQKEGKE